MSRKKILVVDDDQDILWTLREILNAQGYWVRQASGWKDLFKWLNSECVPDLIILDLVIPDFDGFELLSTLKSATSRYQHVPVLVLSGLGEEACVHALECGAAAFLAKPPSDVTELLRVIERLVGAAQP